MSSGLFSLSSSSSESDSDQEDVPKSTSTLSSRPPVASSTSTAHAESQAAAIASAQEVLAGMETESDSDDESENELLLPQHTSKPKPPTATAASASTTAHVTAPVAAASVPTSASSKLPASSPSSVSISAPGSAFKFKLSLGSSRTAPTVSDVPTTSAAAPTADSAPAAPASRKRRPPKSKAELDEEIESAEPKKRPSRTVAASRKKSKKGVIDEDATASLRAAAPMIVERYEWLQCDDPMCGKWRKLQVGQLDQRDLTFPPIAPVTIGDKSHPSPVAASTATNLPLPTFLSLYPCTFEDLSAGKFYCYLNPNLKYARCSAEEEVVAENEVMIS